MALHFGEKRDLPRSASRGHCRIRGPASRGGLVSDVSQDPRYIRVVPDVRSELAIPLLIKDRCIGVVDLESPELDAFSKRDEEILTLLASQAAVASRTRACMRNCAPTRPGSRKRFASLNASKSRFCQPSRPSASRASRSRRRSIGAGARRRFPRLSRPRVEHDGRRGWRRFGERRAGGALQRVCGGARRDARSVGDIFQTLEPGERLTSINTILHQRQLEEYDCTLCYTIFDLKRRTMTMANSGLPYPVRWSGRRVRRRSSCRACRSGRFPARRMTKSRSRCSAGEVFVFCTDGVFEAMNELGAGVHRCPVARCRPAIGASCPPPNRLGDLSGGRRMARRRAAERRHDGRGRPYHRLKSRSVSLRCRPTLDPPNAATSLTRPVTRTCAPRVGNVRPLTPPSALHSRRRSCKT